MEEREAVPQDKLMAYMDYVPQRQEEGRKTEKWKVISLMGSHELGVVSFYPAWRKYVFWPEKNAIPTLKCLGHFFRYSA